MLRMKSQPAGMLLSEDLPLPKNWHHVLLVELLDWFVCYFLFMWQTCTFLLDMV